MESIVFSLFVLAVLVLLANLKVVQQNTVLVVEQFGKFSRIMTAGLNLKMPLFERVASTVSLRQRNFAITGKYPSADKVIVDVTTNLIFSVNPTEEGIKRFTYVMLDPNQSIGAIIENSLRTYVAKETHEGILEKKDELALHIQSDLAKQFEDWGMVINSFQITNVNFPLTITDAMSEVVASQQLRRAAENKGEATKIQAIKEAEAEKERKRLQGEGIALEREAIAEGLRRSIETVQKVTNQSSAEIMSILSLTQYMDMLKGVGTTPNSKVIFMDTQVGKAGELMKQLMASIESGK